MRRHQDPGAEAPARPILRTMQVPGAKKPRRHRPIEAFPGQAWAVLSQLPAPVRVVYRRIFQPRYTARAHWEP